ncbi:MAG: putative zinc-binding metallopeptidase, partial [Gemmatimonadales bacterium]
DYATALQRHYDEGAPPAWVDQHVSGYATAHPWEDWAEAFAHYLHIRDTLQTAAAFGMLVTGPSLDPELMAAPTLVPEKSFDDILADWLPLTYALNAVNRSMGKGDLYPFVLSPAVVEKFAFVHALVAPQVPAPRAEPA